jgi:hypothetical protein
MLEIIGAGASGKSTQDWPAVWRESEEAQAIQTELDQIHEKHAVASSQQNGNSNDQNAEASASAESSEFAMPFTSQLWYVTVRVFQQYWRDPQYIFAKLILGLASALFIGFSFFKPNSSLQGFQDVLFSTFMMTSIFSTLVQQ